MNNFYEQVEVLLFAKPANELKSFVLRITSMIPEQSRQDFLTILENKRIIVSKDRNAVFDSDKTLSRVRKLLEEVKSYNIEAYYYDDWNNDGYQIESDDGFCEEFHACYDGAVSLLEQGLYQETAEAFDLLFQIIDAFDGYNENNDGGVIYVETFIDEGMLEIDMQKMKSLKAYSALMSPIRDMDAIFSDVFDMLREYGGEMTFNDILQAGSEPVPDTEQLMTDWILFLYSEPAEMVSALIKEAALLSGDIGIMEKFVNTAGAEEPVAYINLCELYRQDQAGPEKMMSTAESGLINTVAGKKKRDELANLLAGFAKDAGDQRVYKYAIMERFYSNLRLENFLPVLDTGDVEMIDNAVRYLDKKGMPKKSQYPSSDERDYYAIHFLNGDYDLAFEMIESDSQSLGWSGSIKGGMVPLFIGLLAGFERRALTVRKIIEDMWHCESPVPLYEYLRKNKGETSIEREQEWYTKCVLSAEERVRAIVSGQYRGAYYKAARLLVAVAETRLYRGEGAPMEIIHSYLTKYPRHRSFIKEIRLAAAEAKLTGIMM